MKNMLLGIFYGAFLLLQSNLGVAGGKLVYKPDWRPSKDETAQMLGLSIDQPVAESIHWEGFYGAGRIKGKEGDVDAGDWYKADSSLMAYWGRFGWGVGYAATHEVTDKWEHVGYGKFALTLW